MPTNTTKRSTNATTPPRPHSEWLTLIDQWQAGGLDERAYCDSIGVKLDTFRYHRYRADKAARASSARPSRFASVSLEAPQPAAGIVLHAGRCRIDLPANLSIQAIAELAKALEA